MKSNKLIFDESEFKNAILNCCSIRSLCKWFNKPINGYYSKLFEKWILKFQCNVDHFYSNKPTKQVCLSCQNPKCEKQFLVKFVDRDRKFCSLKCANQKVRGRALPKQLEDLFGQNKHRIICFRYHPRVCVVCKVATPITVHHYDEDHDNDKPENLVPMCANHHILLHSNKYRKTYEPIVDLYVKQFKCGSMV